MQKDFDSKNQKMSTETEREWGKEEGWVCVVWGGEG